MTLSTSPVWDFERVQRDLVLRAFATVRATALEADARRTHRVSTSRDSLVVSSSAAAGSKDTGSRAMRCPPPVDHAAAAAGAPIELTRAGAELPSRVADNLFWLGRYLERAEGTARIAREVLVRVHDESAEAGVALPALLDALGRHAGAPEPLRRDEARLLAFLFEDATPRSLHTTLVSLHQLASSCATDLARHLARALGAAPPPPARSAGARARAERPMMRFAAWSGLSMESMTRSLGWRFVDMGRRIERGAWTGTLLETCLVQPHEDEAPRLEAMLQVAESAITYRRRYRGELQAAPALDLLLTDESNPRALAFQLASLEQHVAALPASAVHASSPEARIARQHHARPTCDVRCCVAWRRQAPAPGRAAGAHARGSARVLRCADARLPLPRR